MTENCRGEADPTLEAILRPDPPPFAVLHRPKSATGPGMLEIIVGSVTEVGHLAGLPLPRQPAGEPGPELMAVVPYRQITERGYACHDDREPILALSVGQHTTVPAGALTTRVPSDPETIGRAAFDVRDDAYAEIVRNVVRDEIGRGEGSNFVIKRTLLASLPGFSPRRGLAIFSRLLRQETGAYWTVIIHTGTRTFIGASPERHLSVTGRTVVMNPISGTYRYPAGGARLAGVLDFLADRKESDELYMVVDEELKMMARICQGGGQVLGPYLKEMARLAHTEYLISGHSERSVTDILRESMFAPTVTGSPLENACRVISRHEPAGRGYYSGVLALIGRGPSGEREMDSAIAIRTADISDSGQARIGVGATLVRLSRPDSEIAETKAKAASLLTALGWDGEPDGQGGGQRSSLPRHAVAPGGAVGGAPADAAPADAAPANGGPASGGPASGGPANGGPAHGGPANGTPDSSVPGGGAPGSSVPARGAQSSGVPASGVPASGAPASGVPSAAGLGEHTAVTRALASRNASLSRFWLAHETARPYIVPWLADHTVAVIDGEDTFTAMLGVQLRSLGLDVEVFSYRQATEVPVADLVVMGPGPGDPRAEDDMKIAALRAIMSRLLAGRQPFLAVCLGHQILCCALGLEVVRRSTPRQGMQRAIDLFGRSERVGFYNTFVAVCDADRFTAPGSHEEVEVSRDPGTGEVHGLRAGRFASLQFHPESVLTEHGPSILGSMLAPLAARRDPLPARSLAGR